MYKIGMCEPDTMVWKWKIMVIWNDSDMTYLKISFTKIESENFFEFDTRITVNSSDQMTFFFSMDF